MSMRNARQWMFIVASVCILALTGCGGSPNEAAPIAEPDATSAEEAPLNATPPTPDASTEASKSSSPEASAEQCAQCEIDLKDKKTREAFISVEINADEYIYSYWRCKICGFYALETYIDRASGSEDITVDKSITPADGRAIVEAITRCPDVRDEGCSCDTHKSIRGDK